MLSGPWEVFGAHDYQRLLRRWQGIARRTRLEMHELTRADGWPVVMLSRGRGGFFISAGIHGDEPAGCEALACWAEQEEKFLSATECSIFPCLNPWGLIYNSRFDSRGRDLNRCYDRRGPAVVAAQRRCIRGGSFVQALTLHEDFDARGVYLYDVGGASPQDGRRLISAAAKFLPLESRRSVEGMRCKEGLIWRRRQPRRIDQGLPEALWLHKSGCPRVWTLETPSEMDLRLRVEAQVAALGEFRRLFLEA